MLRLCSQRQITSFDHKWLTSLYHLAGTSAAWTLEDFAMTSDPYTQTFLFLTGLAVQRTVTWSL